MDQAPLHSPRADGPAVRDIHASKRSQGGPPPLRSEQHPQGLPGLSPQDRKRVDAANAIYLFVVDVCFVYCLDHGIFFYIENPARSLMWYLPIFEELLTRAGVFDMVYDACMHGGARPKRQRLRTNIIALQDWSVLCDGGHEHAPWVTNLGATRVFYTAEAAQYPYRFCARVAARVAWALSGSSKSPQQLRVFQLKAKLAAQRRLNSAVAGRQARSDSAQIDS